MASTLTKAIIGSTQSKYAAVAIFTTILIFKLIIFWTLASSERPRVVHGICKKMFWVVRFFPFWKNIRDMSEELFA